jgi:hypothetical protein
VGPVGPLWPPQTGGGRHGRGRRMRQTRGVGVVRDTVVRRVAGEADSARSARCDSGHNGRCRDGERGAIHLARLGFNSSSATSPWRG